MRKILAKDWYSKCGLNCGRCPSYKGNLLTDEDRQRCSDAWKKYFNFRISPEKLRLCDGCQTPDEKRPVRYINCTARKCAVSNAFETCAVCSHYPCDEVSKYWLTTNKIQEMTDRLGSQIPEDEYLAYLEPFEGQMHLDAIRATLDPREIQDVKKVSFKPKILDFPDDLPLSLEEIDRLKKIHGLLSALESADKVSYAKQLDLKKRRQHIIKILWALGCFGTFDKEDKPSLIIDSATYSEQKIHSYHAIVTDYIQTLKKHGVNCELVPINEKEWLTPTGALRKKHWTMKMSFSKKAGDLDTLKSLTRYASKLDEKYGKDAFRYFSRGDMRIFNECHEDTKSLRK